jgi:hypothetical protein
MEDEEGEGITIIEERRGSSRMRKLLLFQLIKRLLQMSFSCYTISPPQPIIIIIIIVVYL